MDALVKKPWPYEIKMKYLQGIPIEFWSLANITAYSTDHVGLFFLMASQYAISWFHDLGKVSDLSILQELLIHNTNTLLFLHSKIVLDHVHIIIIMSVCTIMLEYTLCLEVHELWVHYQLECNFLLVHVNSWIISIWSKYQMLLITFPLNRHFT